ncbi:MAG: hypothetical protein AB1831_13010 [Pseudomonadota bacterium]
MKSSITSALLISAAVYLSGCASPARVDSMTVAGKPEQRIAASPLRDNLAIKDVTGGKETNPMWKSNIGSPEFEAALESSLRAVGLLAPRQGGRYTLTAHMENVDQPFIGLSMTVTASVRYMVVERSTGKEIFNKVISVPYTASVSDAFLGVERLRLANEGAIRENISGLIDELFRMDIKNVSVN